MGAAPRRRVADKHEWGAARGAMNLGWLAVLGVFLLVAGLCTVAYDGLRRKRGNHHYPYPDAATNRLEDTAVQAAPSPVRLGSSSIIGTRLRNLPRFWARPPAASTSPTNRSHSSA